MNNAGVKIEKRTRRRIRIRAKIEGTAVRPRLSVFRSNRSVYVQLIDDVAGKTLAAVHSREIKAKGGKSEEDCFATEKALGALLAKKALEKKITQAVFDRGGYKYHGKIKAVAEGAREGGLEF